MTPLVGLSPLLREAACRSALDGGIPFCVFSAAEGAPQLERPEHEREDIGEIFPLGKGDKI